MSSKTPISYVVIGILMLLAFLVGGGLLFQQADHSTTGFLYLLAAFIIAYLLWKGRDSEPAAASHLIGAQEPTAAEQVDAVTSSTTQETGDEGTPTAAGGSEEEEAPVVAETAEQESPEKEAPAVAETGDDETATGETPAAETAGAQAAAGEELAGAPETTAEAATEASAEAEANADEPEPVPATPVPPDDLKKIEGIGPKISEILQTAGIRTFADLAAADPARIQEVLTEAGSRYRLADPTTWPEQAQLAADGDWAALDKLQDELDGGRRVS